MPTDLDSYRPANELIGRYGEAAPYNALYRVIKLIAGRHLWTRLLP